MFLSNKSNLFDFIRNGNFEQKEVRKDKMNKIREMYLILIATICENWKDKFN